MQRRRNGEERGKRGKGGKGEEKKDEKSNRRRGVRIEHGAATPCVSLVVIVVAVVATGVVAGFQSKLAVADVLRWATHGRHSSSWLS